MVSSKPKLDPHIFNKVFPVTHLVKLGGGCYRIDRASLLQGQYVARKRERGKIVEMTNASISRLVVTMHASRIKFTSMITLTYPKKFPLTGTVVKDDVGYITKYLKGVYDTPYLWFLEFQKRDAPHVHILVDVDGISPHSRLTLGLKWTHRIILSEWFKEQYEKEPDPSLYAAIEAYKVLSVAANPKTWEMIREPEGARNYVTKYAVKAYQKIVPDNFQDVGRFWACSKEVRPEEKHYIDVTDEEVRKFLEQRGHTATAWEVLPKYLFNVQPIKT